MHNYSLAPDPIPFFLHFLMGPGDSCCIFILAVFNGSSCMHKIIVWPQTLSFFFWHFFSYKGTQILNSYQHFTGLSYLAEKILFRKCG